MKYLPESLRKEYERISNELPDLEGFEPPYINISDSLRAYFILAHYFTDESSEVQEEMLVGVRDYTLLGSAIGRQKTEFGGKKKYTKPIDICATLLYGLVKNHSFSDGNKRTALLILLYQLSLYGYIPNEKQKKFEELVVAIASDSIPTTYKNLYGKTKKADDRIVATISRVIRRYVKKKDHSYHVAPTMKDVCDSLEKLGVNCDRVGNKMHFTYIEKSGWFKKEKKKGYAVSFSGWTRIVGADTLRKVLQKLGLYEQYANYKDFLKGEDPMYQLVNEFETPLRRLKDK